MPKRNHGRRESSHKRRQQHTRRRVVVGVLLLLGVVLGIQLRETGNLTVEGAVEVLKRVDDEVDDVVAVDVDVRGVHRFVNIEEAAAAEDVTLVAVGDDALGDFLAALLALVFTLEDLFLVVISQWTLELLPHFHQAKYLHRSYRQIHGSR